MRSEKYIQPDELNVDNVLKMSTMSSQSINEITHGEKMKLSNC